MKEKPEYPNPDPASPEFWKNRLERKKTCCGRHDRSSSATCWDKAAGTYDDLEPCSDYQKQVNTIISTLRERGALHRNNDIIDIACGTGNYAVRFARECRSVTCVDISRAMLDLLEQKKNSAGISNITTHCTDWRQFDSDRKYDLVFLSMSPILRSPETLDRLVHLSSRHICIVTWAGIRENPVLNDLHMEIFGSPVPAGKFNAFHDIFNYLFTSGHAPDVKFFHGYWERTRDVERQVEGLMWQLEFNRPLDDSEKKLVYDRIESLAQDGQVTIKTRVRTAAMFIDLHDDKKRDCT